MKRFALSALEVRSLDRGKFADGEGLWLVKYDKSAGRWMLRIVVYGKRREMGLGRWPDVSIAEARAQASQARKLVRAGLDPIIEREKDRIHTKRLSFQDAVQGCFEARQAELKGDGKAGRWLSPLNIHILPKIGKMPVEDVDQHILKQTLEGIWHNKADTAAKALQRINLTLKHAAALGLNVDLQAAMKARALLGKQRHTVTHIPSLPYSAAPKFYQWISTKDMMSCYALRFLILTAARTSEVRLAQFGEFHDDVWIIPPERTKTGQEHRIPLTNEAMAVVILVTSGGSRNLVFPSPTGKAMSDAAMARFMEREGYNERPHGFRATFRTWVEEQTTTEYEVKETALGHRVDTGIVGAYQRSDRLEKRRVLMKAWEGFILNGKVSQ
jgi:integrase